jgi:PAT family beta-lactamase induction signal transducer AmpG
MGWEDTWTTSAINATHGTLRASKAVASLAAIFRNRRVLVVFLLGFASGLPFFLTGSTLSAWMTNAHVKLTTIGFLSWIGFAYTFKPLWAPVVDRYQLPLLGRRRGWLLLFQVLLALAVVALGAVGPRLEAGPPSTRQLEIVVAAAVLVAFLSASQDIVIDAYRTDLLEPEERPLGAAAAVLGYRIGMLSSGGGALILSDHLAWRTVYAIMASLVLVGIATTVLLAPEPVADRPPRTLADAVVAPLVDFFTRPGAVQLLTVIVLMGFGDHLARTLTTPFLLTVGYTKTEVGEVTKIFGVVASIVGTIAGGALIARYRLSRMMVVFGALQPLGAACYGLIALQGRSHLMLFLAVATDNVTTAMVAASVDTFAMSLCRKRYSATQFALLMAASSIAGRLVGGGAGWFAERFGWPSFFFSSIIFCLPALLLVGARRKAIDRAYLGVDAETAAAT